MNEFVPTLVETEWLSSVLDDSSIRVVDATWHLPTTDRNGIDDYRNGHIPGAVFWNIDAVADPSSNLPHMIPDEAEFERHMRELGIGSEHHVVVYDAVNMMTAPRVWWTLRTFGHDRVSILDGGLTKWVVEDRALSSAEAKIQDVSFKAHFNPAMIRSLQAVRNISDTNSALLLDARSPGRFKGIEPEPRPNCRPGHIPGSKNLSFTKLIDSETGTLKPVAEIKTLIDEFGVDPDKPVVTTCGSGITACVLALGLHIIGFTDVAVYDGSWTEWGSRTDTPVEK